MRASHRHPDPTVPDSTAPDPTAPGPNAFDPHRVRLRVREPEDLLALVPYLLGFHPAESLVAVLVRDGQVLLTARMDLPGARSGVKDPGLVACLQELVDQHAPSALVLVAYSSDVGLGRTVLGELLERLVEVAVADALLVDGHSWWSLTCTGGCCPADGSPYAPAEHPFAAEAVYAGLSATARREDLEAQLTGPAASEWDSLRRQAGELSDALPVLRHPDRAGLMAEAVVAALGELGVGGPDPAGSGALSDRTCLRLALLADDVRVRDVACALVTRERALEHVALWQRVVARVPPELAVAPLCLLGLAGWAAGNGALLNCCCARVHELDPACSMGQLLAGVSARALPPSYWDALAADLRNDLGLVGR